MDPHTHTFFALFYIYSLCSVMSTVTRRRVAGHSSNSDDDNNNSSSSVNYNNPTTEKKIAYDPHDVDERKSTPKLTLMEEVLLLGLKDKQVISD